jgi:hypothetical protein
MAFRFKLEQEDGTPAELRGDELRARLRRRGVVVRVPGPDALLAPRCSPARHGEGELVRDRAPHRHHSVSGQKQARRSTIGGFTASRTAPPHSS